MSFQTFMLAGFAAVAGSMTYWLIVRGYRKEMTWQFSLGELLIAVLAYGMALSCAFYGRRLLFLPYSWEPVSMSLAISLLIAQGFALGLHNRTRIPGRLKPLCHPLFHRIEEAWGQDFAHDSSFSL